MRVLFANYHYFISGGKVLLRVIYSRMARMNFVKLLDREPPDIIHLQSIHGKALRYILLKARAVILPSICYKNQPFTITEAFAAGKPVIASDLSGITELVKHWERGLLVPPGDVAALAEAMRWISEHPDDARMMGENARRYAQIVHSADKHYEGLMKIYAQHIN